MKEALDAAQKLHPLDAPFNQPVEIDRCSQEQREKNASSCKEYLKDVTVVAYKIYEAKGKATNARLLCVQGATSDKCTVTCDSLLKKQAGPSSATASKLE